MFFCAIKSCPMFLLLFYFFVSFYVLYQPVQTEHVSKKDLLLLTVATEETDGYNRFIRSANVYNVPTKVLGMGQQWEGGDMSRPGGGHKVVLFKEALQQLADDKDKIVLFTDSYDVIMLGTSSSILEQFRSLDARIVFAAEPYCWPDQSLADQYPVTESRYKYLNSGGIIGYASDLYELLDKLEVSSSSDDQLFYTKLYLDKDLRDKYRMKLDHKAAIFQTLNGAADDLDIVEGSLVNVVHSSHPLVLHGNGLSKLHLNSLGNYLAHSWTSEEGCITCHENNIDLTKISKDEYPTVLIALHITVPTPFIREFFDKIIHLDYPPEKISFFLYNGVEYHKKDVKLFIENVKNMKHYKEHNVKEIKPEDEIKDSDARTLAVNYCISTKCDYLFSVDSIAHLDNPATLKTLIFLNRTIIAPVIARHKKAWSNFWGDLTKDGFYARSFDYMDIVNNDRRGLWNVPYVSSVYLINSTLLHLHKPHYHLPQMDSDMAFCKSYRDKGVFMYVTNVDDFGHLVDPEGFDTSRTHPDMYEMLANQPDWEQRFISPLYQDNFKPHNKPEQPCPDVYWFPVVTPEFCDNFIEIMETFGKWSDGSNTDNRLVGGYENVPTRDVHLNQVGLEPMWMEFLKLFVRPLQEHVFIGYFHDPPRSLMNFVVRYRPDEQPSLRPHHDSSTYTINLALNRPNIDYQGGGCHFLRYNCSVTETRIGWLLMHPGRLTHFHEGLPVTNGTRYIMISFVDP